MRSRRQIFGQHFLVHEPTLKKIKALIEERLKSFPETKSILEIGPGRLALTRSLIAIGKAINLPIIAVERDRILIEDTKKNAPEVQFQYQDAASEQFVDFLKNLQTQGLTPIFVASNLPYSASSQILARLCQCSHLLTGATVMIQKELAKRMMAPPKSSERGAFTLFMESYFKIQKEFDVGPGAFRPPPKVESTVVSLFPLQLNQSPIRHVKDTKNFEHFCKLLFSQRRKMIHNILGPSFKSAISEVGLSGHERPQELNLETIVALYCKRERLKQTCPG